MNHPSIRCGILGHAFVSGDAAQIAAWRNNPGTFAARSWPQGMLRQSEDQTVVSLVALLQVIQNKEFSESEMAKWGVIAGPLFLGRAVLAAAFVQFSKDGAWGVSPHLIPHRFLHSVSGTLSQALGMHGPNFGVGGGASSHLEAIATACMLAGHSHSAGMWLVLTGYEPDRPPDSVAGSNSPWRCHALALALAPVNHPQTEHTLCVTPGNAISPNLYTQQPMQFMHDLAHALSSVHTHHTAFAGGTEQFAITLTRNEPARMAANLRAA